MPGLNDGIATPFLSVALAGAATGGQVAGHGPAAAVAMHGNGFFGGLAFGTTGGRRGEPRVPFVKETGALVSLLVWLLWAGFSWAPRVLVSLANG